MSKTNLFCNKMCCGDGKSYWVPMMDFCQKGQKTLKTLDFMGVSTKL